jgi:hypothetical protein
MWVAGYYFNLADHKKGLVEISEYMFIIKELVF